MNVEYHLYADDTAISVSGCSTMDLEQKLNRHVALVSKWMETNQLTLNTSKTIIMTSGTAQTLKKVGPLNIKTEDNVELTCVDSTKYLGVILDQKLTFEDHVAYVKCKCSGRLKMLAKLRSLVGEHTSMSLYKSLIVPISDYADVAFDILSAKCCNELQCVQNSALK